LDEQLCEIAAAHEREITRSQGEGGGRVVARANIVNKALRSIPPNFSWPQLQINVFPLKQTAEKQILAGFP
jgi:hypothetical protein